MRIPLFICIPLSILTLLLTWWVCTRKVDFLTPPSEADLATIRQQALASLPVAENKSNPSANPSTSPTKGPSAPEPAEPVGSIEVGDLSPPKHLDTYSDWAPDGASKLLRLGAELERQGAFQRALLAYERVIDLSQANQEQIQSALESISRIRPTLTLWNNDPKLRHSIVIHIGTGQKFADLLPAILEEIDKELRIASSGQIQFNHKLNIGKSIQTTKAPTPVAIWMTGGDEKTVTTDVLSFTTNNGDTLRNDILKTVFNLIRGQLAKSTSYNPAPEITDHPLLALYSNITRLLWSEFGKNMNPPAKGP
ncbi:MAG: hypothetical protein RL346_806 [Verrucomicrobiota bacterium]|jgi:transcriptional regulator